MSGNKLFTLEDTTLYKLLGADGMEELKSRIIDLIVEEVRSDFENYSCYLVDPDDVSYELNKVAKEVVREVKAEYKQKLAELVASKLNLNIEL